VRSRGHRVKHDSRMLDRPPRPVYRSGTALKVIPRRRVRFGSAQSRRRPGPSPTRWIPQDCELTERDESLASWDSIPEDEKPFQRHLMEVAAGYAEHVDAQVGRLVDELDRLGYAENTLFLYIWGDNGSSGEGQNGTIAELLAENSIPTTVRQHIDALDELGGLDVLGSPLVDNQYHASWAWAGVTPYKGMKLLASHLGGTRNPLAVRWPKKVAPDSVPRDQFLHCTDVVPTIYDILGIEPPLQVNGVQQLPIAGASFAQTLTDRSAPGGRKTQYFEIMGSRSIYHDGWMASAFGPRTPWLPGAPPGIATWTPDNDRWELYNLDEDWSQAHDLADEMPENSRSYGKCSRSSRRATKCCPLAGAVGAGLSPRTPHRPAVHRVGVLRRPHPDAGVLRARAG
jgi:arylsulfatase A-like enzyme